VKSAAYLLSKRAVSDLEEIWLFTFRRWSAEQADRYYNLIIDEIKFISRDVYSGKSIDHIKKGYRSAKVKSHLIFYRISSTNVIEVIRILHESMDIPNRLGD